jgi:hypothetical protein
MASTNWTGVAAVLARRLRKLKKPQLFEDQNLCPQMSQIIKRQDKRVLVQAPGEREKSLFVCICAICGQKYAGM